MRRFDIANVDDGTPIPAIFDAPQSDRYGGVYLLLHGLATGKDEYLGFYTKLGEALVQRGYAVLRIDFRGHGDSLAPGAEFTVTSALGDAASALAWLLDHTRNETVRVFGTSFGASISVLLAALFPRLVSDLTLLAPVLDYRRLYIEPENEERRARYANLVETAVLEGQPREIDDRIAFGQAMVLNLATIPVWEALGALDCPITIMHGDKDGAVPVSMSQQAAQIMSSIKLHVFSGMEHGFTELGDENGDHPQSLQNFAQIVELAAA